MCAILAAKPVKKLRTCGIILLSNQTPIDCCADASEKPKSINVSKYGVTHFYNGDAIEIPKSKNVSKCGVTKIMQRK